MNSKILCLVFMLATQLNAFEFKSLEQLIEHPKILSAQYKMCEKILKDGSFKWTSIYKKSQRSVKPMQAFGQEAIETILHFSNKRVSKVELLYFSKADSKAIKFYEFDKKRINLGKELNKKLNVKSKGVKDKLTNSEKNRIYEWIRGNVRYRLEAVGTSSKDLEYLRLVINYSKARKVRYRTASQIQRMVKRTSEGDVYINYFPMVDQGAKGYCVCASLARVLQHYGRDIGQHEVAQLANSSKFGTSPQDLLAALEELSPKLHVDNHPLGDFALGKVYIRQGQTYQDFVAKAKRYFQDNRVKFSRYENHLFFAIDAGRPVAWALLVGLIEEKGIEAGKFYGHMRVIVGYNKKTREVIYTDSWGYGHELKRMKIDDAMTASFGMWEMRPEF